MGSSLHHFSVSVAAVTENLWKTSCGDCSSAIDSLVGLLQGRLSNAVIERICERGTGLFQLAPGRCQSVGPANSGGTEAFRPAYGARQGARRRAARGYVLDRDDRRCTACQTSSVQGCCKQSHGTGQSSTTKNYFGGNAKNQTSCKKACAVGEGKCRSPIKKSAANDTAADFQGLAERTGLEPATPGVTGRYSNQLNYHSW